MRQRRKHLSEKEEQAIRNLMAYGTPVYEIMSKFKLKSTRSIYRLLEKPVDTGSLD